MIVQPLLMDISKKESVDKAAKLLAEQKVTIDVLINNAGVLLDRTPSLLTASESMIRETFDTNAFGALFVVQAMLPLLNPKARIINVSSEGGQICEGVSTWSPLYCMSKTLLNALTLQLASVLESKFVVNAMCPGWVKTEMGGGSAPLPVSKGAETAVWLALDVNEEITGKFFSDQKEISW